ncbi:hypothetical protein NQ317_005876 [Molorchus minor]|uniref:Large ribosomal subunit protein uL3m n=1 Tax=Molorchus minor TaxID=1323400 RepID=A0ABQ9JZY3_9CUCU|nr:hypothetical protein NQ317_005876 [Molorchus minor]
MALTLSNFLTKYCTKSLDDKFLTLSITCSSTQIREKHLLNPKPKLRNPTWFTKKLKSKSDELVTPENEEFVREVVQDRYDSQLPLQKDITNIEWVPKLQRTGILAKKIGVYPMWFKNGKKIQTTLLQVLDNHVIRYYTPEEYDPPRKRIGKIYNKKGCLLLGAEGADPSDFTREYCGIFRGSGVIPKKILGRFFVSPEAALPLGTLINCMHFQVGKLC